MSAGCSGCDRRWTSLTQAHCQTCHRQFASHGVADRHHTYGPNREQVCHDPATLTTKNKIAIFISADEAEGIVWRTYRRTPRPPMSPVGDESEGL